MNDADKAQLRGDRAVLIQALVEAGAVQKGKMFLCPFHQEKTASGSVYEKSGVWRFHCHGCKADEDVIGVRALAEGRSAGDILKSASPPDPRRRPVNGNGAHEKPVKTWPTVEAMVKSVGNVTGHWVYTNPETRAVELVVIRYNFSDGGKRYIQASPAPGGGFHMKAAAKPWPLYNRSRLRAEPANFVIICEGEKSVHRFTDFGYLATTSPGGAGKASLADWSELNGRSAVYLWPDNDPPNPPDHPKPGVRTGFEHMEDVAAMLSKLPNPPVMYWVEVEKLGLPPKGDVVEFAEKHGEGTREAIAEVLDGARRHESFGIVADEVPADDAIEQPYILGDRHREGSATGLLAPDQFGTPIPLETPLPPELPSGILTGWFGDMVQATADSTETPVEMALSFGIITLATSAQGRFSVCPEYDYFEPLNFWMAPALPSGSRKTTVVQTMSEPLVGSEREWRRDFDQKKKAWELRDNITREQIKGLMSQMKAEQDPTAKNVLEQKIEELNSGLVEAPIMKRLIIEDCTPEHVATVLSQQEERITIISDEGGLLETWGGRYSSSGKTANIDVFLKGYSGSHARIDRVGRPPISLDHPLISVGLSPQPSVIQALFGNQVFRSRGLIARFFILVPRSTLGYRTLRTCRVDTEIKETYANKIKALLGVMPRSDGDRHFPNVLKLDGDAWKFWKDFAGRVEAMMRPDGLLERATDFGGKLPGACIRVAGLFHLADHGADALHSDSIAFETMQRAVAFCDYAAQHFVRAMSDGDPKGHLEIARRLWRGVQNGDVKADGEGIIRSRDLWNPTRNTYRRVEDVEGGIGLLIDHNYIIEAPHPEHGKRGRPSRRFKVNPLVMGR